MLFIDDKFYTTGQIATKLGIDRATSKLIVKDLRYIQVTNFTKKYFGSDLNIKFQIITPQS